MATASAKPERLRIERDARIDSLLRHPDNAREGDVGAIAESIRAHGFFTVPLAQASTRRVLVGWHRIQAAREADMATIPRVAFVDCGDEEARRIVLVDNRTSDLAAYDQAKLAAVLRELAESGPDPDVALAGTGFDGDALDALLRDLGEQGGPKDFKELGDDLKTEWRCPKCGYEWSAKTGVANKLPPI
jgi:rubrerythrin